MPLGEDDIKFILSAEPGDLSAVNKAIDDLEAKAGTAFDPLLDAARRVRSELQQTAVDELYEKIKPQTFMQKLAAGKDSALGRFGTVAGAVSAAQGGTGLSGGEIGGLVSSVAPQLGGAVTVASKIIETPFKLMAQSAQNSVRALNELEGPLGVMGVGMERSAQAMEKIPIIGEHLAASERASKSAAEQNIRFMGKLSPMFSEMLHQAQSDMQALSVDREKANQTLEANQTYRDALGSLKKAGNDINTATLERRMGLKKGENWWGITKEKGVSDDEMRRMELELKLLRAVEAGEKTFDIFDKRDFKNYRYDIDEAFEKVFGHKIEKGAGVGAAARPAQFQDIMGYQSQLQQKAFSQGSDPQKETSDTLKKLFDWLKNQAGAGDDPTGLGAIMKRFLGGE